MIDYTTEYTECQAFSPVVRIGFPRPLTGKRVLPPPPLVPWGGGGTHSLGGEGAGGANSDKNTLWHTRYYTINI
jgi:hypothetical protein